MILNGVGENRATINLGGTPARDGSGVFETLAHDVFDRSCRVVNGDLLDLRMPPEKVLTLGQSYRVRERLANLIEADSGSGDERVLNAGNPFPDNFQVVLEQQVIAAVDGPRQCIFDRDHAESGFTPGYRIENILKGFPRQQPGFRRKQLQGGIFAECAAAPLIGSIVHSR